MVFGSFQDLLGTNENGGIKAKNEFIHTTQWDLVIFDEYHFGAWRENAKKLFENPDEEENADFDMEQYKRTEADNAYNETFLPISTGYYLFLSGTPFRAINSGEFIEDQIYNWTYSDEQNAKESWIGLGNPYLALPRMVMLTYRIPESIRQIAVQGEYDEFDLNVFFSAKGKGADAKFVYENEVQKWLDLIRGSYLPSSVDDLKLGQDKRPPMRIEGFRSLNQDITAIINKSEAVKKAKKEKEQKLTDKEKKELSQEEKEYKSMRKQIQEKLIKFATRVPVFMYLTDYRERSLKDVITQLEPGLFKKVTGLDVNDFNLLCSIGVFNASLMNDAIFKFKRYEDSSLSYTGIEKNISDEIGGWDTVIRREEYQKLFFNQQATMDFVAEAMPEIVEEIAPAVVESKVAVTQDGQTVTPADYDRFSGRVGIVVTSRPEQPQEQEEKPELDLSGAVADAVVIHKKFGEGKIGRQSIYALPR